MDSDGPREPIGMRAVCDGFGHLAIYVILAEKARFRRHLLFIPCT